MTAKKLALIRTTKLVAITIFMGFLVGTILTVMPLNYLLTASACAFLIFMLKMVYDMNLAQARIELQEKQIDQNNL
jgi:uncharacterized membrane protein